MSASEVDGIVFFTANDILGKNTKISQISHKLPNNPFLLFQNQPALISIPSPCEAVKTDLTIMMCMCVSIDGEGREGGERERDRERERERERELASEQVHRNVSILACKWN